MSIGDKRIVVLSDGETWSGLKDAKILKLTDAQYARIVNGEKPSWVLADDDSVTTFALDIFET